MCMYHLFQDDEYHLILSSLGNEDLVKENTKLLGSDTLGDCRVNCLTIKPIYEGDTLKEIKCTHIMLIPQPTSAPSFVVSKIAASHALILTDQLAYIQKH